MQDRCLIRALNEAVKVTSPEQAATYLMAQVFTPFAAFEQEEFWAFPLNEDYRLTHQIMVYRGTINAIDVRPAEVFRTAIRLNAARLLLAHNHPCGQAEPSRADLYCHQSLRQAGELLGIEIVDHIIVGDQQWQSLRLRCDQLEWPTACDV